jgi:hypothetical protein
MGNQEENREIEQHLSLHLFKNIVGAGQSSANKIKLEFFKCVHTRAKVLIFKIISFSVMEISPQATSKVRKPVNYAKNPPARHHKTA